MPLLNESTKIFLIKGISFSFFIKISNVALSLFSNIILARILGVSDFGKYSYVIAVIFFLTILTTLGFPGYLVREIPKYHLKKEWALLKGLIIRAYQAVSLTGLILGSVFFLAVTYLKSEDYFLYFIAIFLLVVNSLNSIVNSTLRGLKHIILGQLPEFFITPILFLSLIGIVWFLNIKIQTYQIITAQLICTAISLSAGLFFLFKVFPLELNSTFPEYKTKTWFKNTAPFLFIGTMMLINNQTDIIMLGIMKTSEEVGLYKIAMQGAHLTVFILIATNVTIGPLISHLYQNKEMNELQNTATKCARIILFFALPIGLFLIFYGSPVISFIFGEEYLNAAPALSILCFGQIINAGMGSVGLILSMTGHEKDTLFAFTLSGILNILLNACLIPLYGIIGAAWATMTSTVVWNIILTYLVYKRLKIKAHAF